jgi:type I restriction enzyme S subunit
VSTDRQVVRLGDYVELLTGFPFKSAHYIEDGTGVRLLRGDNIGQGTLRWSGVKRWPEHLEAESSPYRLEDGDVVIAMDRPWIEAGLKYAAVTQSDLPCFLVQRVARLRARAGLDQRFLRYVIGSRGFTEHVVGVQTGTAVPHISGDQIREFEFELPSIDEQRRIAEVLISLDLKIEANVHARRTSRKLGIALFDQELERGMKQASVGDLALSLNRGVAPKYCDPRQGVVVLNQKCIRDGWAMTSAARWMQNTPVPDGKTAKRNDVIVNSTGVGTLGRVARWLESEPVAVDGHVTVVRPDAGCYSPVVFGYAMLAAQEQLAALGEGSTGQTELSRVRLAEFRVVVPNDPSRIEGQLEAIDDNAQSLLRESDALTAIRDALLPRLLSGEIRVCDAEAV